MGLDQELCHMARDLYRWDISFEGQAVDVLALRNISEERWIPEERGVVNAELGLMKIGADTRYGFIDSSEPVQIQYQPSARIYSSRADNYQADLLEILLSHLRIDVTGPAKIRFPAELAGYVTAAHVDILTRPEKDPNKLSIGETPICDTTQEASRTVALGQLDLFEPC